MRRQFTLPADDEAHLTASGLPWETVRESGGNWLLVHDHPGPPGYTATTATVAVRIEPNYPPGCLDMAYFYPPLARADGKPIAQITSLVVDGRTFQRWSRHYPWRPDEDTLVSHLLRVSHWLERELAKG